VEKGLEMGISSLRGTVGKPGRGSSTRDLERSMKEALQEWSVSL
jgi:hypothetical protein